MKHTALFVILCLAGFGCDGSPSDLVDDTFEDATDTDGKADGVIRPAGTFRGETPSAGQLTVVVLKTDMTFHRETMVNCVMAPCATVAEDGTYGWSKYGTTRYIRFKDANGDLIDRYAYELDGDDLELRASGSSTWIKYVAGDQPWCGVPDDCALQNLPVPRCIGQWICGAANVCQFDCNNQWCMAGTVVSGPGTFVASADGMECKMPEAHCLTDDGSSCPQLNPLPPGWCSGGTVVAGPGTFIDSADGMECKMPEVHCVTNDWTACPQLNPLPPGWCANGTVISGPHTYVDSADGMECAIPSVHCVTNDMSSCPQF